MTQEEKARAYDEALNKAKIEINTKGIGEAVDLCYQLFPQLAESDDEESDDERIRKFLIQHISEWIGCIEHDLKISSKDIESEKELAMFKAALAYLEKQKESLPISETCKENANSFADGIIEVRSFQRGMEEGRRLERQKEQKQAQTSEEKEYVRTIKSIISDFIRDKKPENLAYYQRIYDWLDGRHVPFSCGHENGQPADYNEFKMLMDGAMEDGRIEGRKEVIDHPDKYGLTKQKPVERSLEDDHIIGFVYDLLNEIEWKDNWAMSKEECLRLLSNYRPQKPVDFPTTDEEVKEFLETHPKVEVPEKYKTPDPVFSKQEYESYPIISEDTTSAKPVEFDGKTLLYTADKSYQIGFRDGVASVKPAECSKVTINGEPIPTETKSVDIPLAEWSEEDEKMIDDICFQLDGYPEADVCEMKSWLKSLRPSWKPSEGQMEALDKARRFIPYNCDALESLYVDLKKL